MFWVLGREIWSFLEGVGACLFRLSRGFLQRKEQAAVFAGDFADSNIELNN